MTAYAAPSGRMQRRRAFFRRLRLYIYTGGSLLLLVGLGYLAIASPLFKVGELSIQSSSAVDKDALIASLKAQVAAGSWGWLGADNYLAWSSNLHYSTPHVKEITVEKSFWSRSIIITVQARERYAVWCNPGSTEDSCYWIDHEGIVFEYAPVADGQLVQTIFDTATSTPGAIGEPVLPLDEFSAISKTLDRARHLNLPIHKITVDRLRQELWLDTDAGTRIMLSLRFDPEPAALPAIERFIQKPGLSKLEYLNLTVENRAFVKYR